MDDLERVKDWPAWVEWRLTAAFKALRKQGYIARQRFSCCGSCAGAQIASDVHDMADTKRKRLLGAVYYHRQDADALQQPKMRRLHIRYGQVHVYGSSGDSPAVYGKAEAEIGQDVARALRTQGLCIEWDGNPERTIVVLGLDQTVIDAARATVRLGGQYEDVLNKPRASGK